MLWAALLLLLSEISGRQIENVFMMGLLGVFIVLLFLEVFLRTNLAVVCQVYAHCHQYVIAGLFGQLKSWKPASSSTLWEVKLASKMPFYLCHMEAISSHRSCMLAESTTISSSFSVLDTPYMCSAGRNARSLLLWISIQCRRCSHLLYVCQRRRMRTEFGPCFALLVFMTVV